MAHIALQEGVPGIVSLMMFSPETAAPLNERVYRPQISAGTIKPSASHSGYSMCRRYRNRSFSRSFEKCAMLVTSSDSIQPMCAWISPRMTPSG